MQTAAVRDDLESRNELPGGLPSPHVPWDELRDRAANGDRAAVERLAIIDKQASKALGARNEEHSRQPVQRDAASAQGEREAMGAFATEIAELYRTGNSNIGLYRLGRLLSGLTNRSELEVLNLLKAGKGSSDG